MKHYVTDTMGLIRHLAKSEKLGKNAATAVLLGLGLISRDSVIGKSAFLTTIW